MAKKIIEKGVKPMFVGQCPVCDTKFYADVEDCDLEHYELPGCTPHIEATTACPLCGCTTVVKVDKML